MKNKVINIRLSDKDYNIIKFVSIKKDTTISNLILSVLLSYCLSSISDIELLSIYSGD